MNITTHTYNPNEKLPKNIVIPTQTHSIHIQEIITGNEDLSNTDGLWTRNPKFTLGIKTADCAPICFWDGEKFGIIHAGWHGLVNGICENMLTIFTNPDTKVWVGPLYHEFEIQQDNCYDQIKSKFGNQFLIHNQDGCCGGEESITFNFKGAIHSLLPQAQFDPRNTCYDKNLASWRRDHDKRRNLTIIRTKKFEL